MVKKWKGRWSWIKIRTNIVERRCSKSNGYGVLGTHTHNTPVNTMTVAAARSFMAQCMLIYIYIYG